MSSFLQSTQHSAMEHTHITEGENPRATHRTRGTTHVQSLRSGALTSPQASRRYVASRSAIEIRNTLPQVAASVSGRRYARRGCGRRPSRRRTCAQGRAQEQRSAGAGARGQRAAQRALQLSSSPCCHEALRPSSSGAAASARRGGPRLPRQRGGGGRCAALFSEAGAFPPSRWATRHQRRRALATEHSAQLPVTHSRWVGFLWGGTPRMIARSPGHPKRAAF